jgi:hypothetical protein
VPYLRYGLDGPLSRYSATRLCPPRQACQYCTSTPDQRRCSVACRLGLSQIDKLDGQPVTGAASNTYMFHELVRTVYTHRLSVMLADARLQITLFFAQSRRSSEHSGGRRRPAHLRKTRLTKRAALHRPLCPAGKEASLPSRPSARNHLHRFVCSWRTRAAVFRARPTGTCTGLMPNHRESVESRESVQRNAALRIRVSPSRMSSVAFEHGECALSRRHPPSSAPQQRRPARCP